MKELIIWWSTGDFYRISDARNTDEYILKYFAISEANALEIMFHGSNRECTVSKEIIENNFSHCSLHAPVHIYQDDESSHIVLKNIERICWSLPIKNIVIHPDTVVDWSVFKQYSHLPFSIENMDDRKTSCRSVEDIQKILEEHPYMWFTLDLQHCYTNDPTMQLAKDFHKVLWHKIVEYHLSWYHPELLHYPLFKTHQDEIIKSLENRDIPIIIESTFDNQDELAKEITYIKSFM